MCVGIKTDLFGFPLALVIFPKEKRKSIVSLGYILVRHMGMCLSKAVLVFFDAPQPEHW